MTRPSSPQRLQEKFYAILSWYHAEAFGTFLRIFEQLPIQSALRDAHTVLAIIVTYHLRSDRWYVCMLWVWPSHHHIDTESVDAKPQKHTNACSRHICQHRRTMWMFRLRISKFARNERRTWELVNFESYGKKTHFRCSEVQLVDVNVSNQLITNCVNI